MHRDPRAAEALVGPPSGDTKKDRLAIRGLLAQASDESRQSPFDDLEFGEWWDRYGRWLWRGWPETVRLHPGWIPILRTMIDEGPEGCDWLWPNWYEHFETVMAVWLLRGPQSLLPLLRELTRPTDHPRLAFVVVHDYLERGPHPLTTEILDLLEDALPHVPFYDDDTAEWLVCVVHAARTQGLFDALAVRLTPEQPVAKSVLENLRESD